MARLKRPRCPVFRSNRHIYVQVIDDVAGLAPRFGSTKSKTLRDKIARRATRKRRKIIGEAIAKQAMGVGIKLCVF